jgi:hypothetical protein
VNDRPTAVELLEAVRRFLSEDAVPALEGPLRYQARVAANVVGIVAREIASEEEQLRGEWERLGDLLGDPVPAPAGQAALREGVRARSQALALRIRSGEADSGPWRRAVLAHLRRCVADKLAVARPPASS